MKKYSILMSMVMGCCACFSQNIKLIKGDWKPQSFDYSCWAASLSNASLILGSPGVYTEVFFLNEHRYAVSTMSELTGLANLKYKLRFSEKNQTLKWATVLRNIKYSNARPMVYSFNADGTDYHCVNIFGFEVTRLKASKLDKWLYIYDPKPDSIGNRYVKNFESYLLVNNNNDVSRGTIHQITDISERKRRKIRKAYQQVNFSQNYQYCRTKNDVINTLWPLFYANLSNDFKSTVGLPAGSADSLYVMDSTMAISNFQNSVRERASHPVVPSDTASYQLVSQNYRSSEIIPFVTKVGNKLNFRTGVVLRLIKPNCWIVDQIIDIGFLNKLDSINLTWNSSRTSRFPSVTLDVTLAYITDEAGNRFIEITKDNTSRYYDQDNFLNNSMPSFLTKDQFYDIYFKKKFAKFDNRKIEQIFIPSVWSDDLQDKYRISNTDFIKFKNTGVKKIYIQKPMVE